MTAIGYITLVAVLSTVTAETNQRTNTDQNSKVPIPIYYTLQLPKLQDPVPFYNPEIASELQPPNNNNNYYNVPIYYEYQAPSQELQPPNPEAWNPNNEETYYYPSEFQPVEQPTNSHPKKYNKEVHDEKVKLLNPKGDVLSDNLEQRRKTLERFSKSENKKQISAEKAQSSV